MKITYNGNEIEIREGTSLGDFISEQKLQLDGLAAAVDEEIIPKSSFNEYLLKDGAKLDIFKMVAGGCCGR